MLGEGLKNIGEGAFQRCISLHQISFPTTVTIIENQAFDGDGCLQLVEPRLSEGLEKIGVNSFSGCTSLQHIHIPTTVTSFDWTVFDDCGYHLVIEYSSEVEELLS